MKPTLIKNARIVNEGKTIQANVRIVGERIDKIAPQITAEATDNIVDANGKYLLPGMIDDQVHFREPGLTHKGSISTESRAAVAGGITSFMEMPNVTPSTTTMQAIEDKCAIAKQNAFANYAFYLGATEDNLDVIKAIDPNSVCGVKVFMGASTGNLLVENTTALEAIFRESPVLIATHCESGPVMADNLANLLKRSGKTKQELTIHDHPIIRDDEACYASSSYAVSLAKKYNSQLHVLHITTAKELSLFEAGEMQNKRITAEACVHHLWFSDADYANKDNFIKCNPAVKTLKDRDALRQALLNNQIDIVATDHAPHTLAEKQAPYPNAPAGLPLVQHALLSMMAHVQEGWLPIETVVEKICHNPAIRYGVAERGFIREGYFADLVLVDPAQTTTVTHDNALYHCGWTPFDGTTFPARICSTWVNGELMFDGEKVLNKTGVSKRLSFLR